MRRVKAHGVISFHNRSIFVGRGLAGLTVAVRPTTTDGRFQVVFCHQQIGQSVLRDSDDV